VVVESLGEFLDRNLNDYQLEPLLRLKDQVGVRVQTGAVGFEGSTVPGELRELCGIRLLTVNPSVSVLQTETCLPRTFHNLGYRTTAIHGFLGTLFSRNRWYPSLGFDDIWFAPELDRKIKNAKRCGIAFHGLCDTEIWNLIEKLVTRKPPTNQFIYWITLSAHLPIENLPTESQKHCNGFEVMARHPDLCSLVLKQRELFSRIAKSIGEKKINNTRILIVGDHAPPFLDARVRSFSDPANVPFIDIQS
jgi:phosphoglycerol transferase MdoB-like AlkP superfamily enzyme